MCSDDGCCCKDSHGRIQRFIEPCLLLLLAQKPTHGYDLIDKLSLFGFDGIDPGTIYRYLREMEKNQLVTSEWITEGKGPAKRKYELTGEGKEYLLSWQTVIKKNREILNIFLQELEELNFD